MNPIITITIMVFVLLFFLGGGVVGGVDGLLKFIDVVYLCPKGQIFVLCSLTDIFLINQEMIN